MCELRADVAAGAGARQSYEALSPGNEDAGSNNVRAHRLTCEITHADMFMKVLVSTAKVVEPMFGSIKPSETRERRFLPVFCPSQGDYHCGP